MVILGITGGIATGKSAVADVLASTGVRVVDCDAISRYLTANDPAVLHTVRLGFGDRMFKPGGVLDRQQLASLVFNDETARRKLELILHPLIAGVVQENVQSAKMQGLPLVVVIPLLYEAGMQDMVEVVWVVSAPEKLQVERQAARDGASETAALSRIRAQMPMEQKKLLADLVIENSGSLDELTSSVLRHWEALTEKHA
jgi:dephospho-CoA kinase